MEDLIKQAFAHVEVTGPHVQEGHYDLIGPDGEIILPVVWEKTVQPGFQISMRMWPMDKHPLPGPRFPPNLSPEQREAWIMHQRRQMAAAAAQGGHGHHAGAGRVPPMRPPAFTGVPFGGNPPPPPGGMRFPPPGGEGGRGPPPGVDIVDAKHRKEKGKKSKKAISFFSGASSKPKKSGSKKLVYLDDPMMYPLN
jgi:hypothetical protein